jgi:hypothetical protein
MLYDPKKWAMPEVAFAHRGIIETLEAARAMIEHRWCPRGGSDEMGGVCIIAALSRVTGWQSPEYESARSYIRSAIPNLGTDSLPEWNDASGRTQGEVIAAFDRAIALARASD